MIAVLFFTLISSFFYHGVATAQSLQNDYFQPDFRSGHNMTILLSGEYTTWSVSQSSASVTNQDAVSSIQQSKFIPGLFLRYSYHFNFISSFGFFVGSTAGFVASNGYYGSFFPGYGIFLPTVTLGLVQNFPGLLRLIAGAEYGAAWYPNMTVTTHSGTVNSLSAIPHIFSGYVGTDFFFDRHTAFSTQVGGRYFYVPCLNSCSSSNYLNSFDIRGQSLFAQAGLTWLFN